MSVWYSNKRYVVCVAIIRFDFITHLILIQIPITIFKVLDTIIFYKITKFVVIYNGEIKSARMAVFG